MSEESGSILTRPQLEHAIRRNFSGYDEFEAVDEFKLWKLEVYMISILMYCDEFQG